MSKTFCAEITPLPVSQKEEETKSQIPAGYNLPRHSKQVAVTTPKYFSLSKSLSWPDGELKANFVLPSSQKQHPARSTPERAAF